MNKSSGESETGCCKKFNPDPWDKGEVAFTDKLFLQDTIHTAFRIPLNFSQVIKRNHKKIKVHNALCDDYLMLYEDVSPFRAHVYIAVNKEIPKSHMTKIEGHFLTKVFEGEYKNIAKWTKEMHEYVRSQAKTAKKMYVFYTTCPRCAQYYKKNYVVILAKI